MGTEKSLYIGCALTHAPEQFRNDVSGLKQILREEHGINVLDFVGLENGTEVDVYQWDILECVSKCNAFLGIYGYPGDGLGYETTIANARGIPRLGVAHENAKVSRLILGSAQYHDYPFERYRDMHQDIPRLVIREFIEIHNVL